VFAGLLGCTPGGAAEVPADVKAASAPASPSAVAPANKPTNPQGDRLAADQANRPDQSDQPNDPDFVAALARAAARSPIKRDEVVHLFPVDVSREPSGASVLEVHGWIYEPEVESYLRKSFMGQLQAVLELSDAQLDSELLKRRLAPFLVDNERAKQIDLVVGEQVVRSRASGANGHFFARLALGPTDLARARAGELEISAVVGPGDARSFIGRAHVVDPAGVLLISDIDDTVKVSEVLDKRVLLRRTFLEEFRLVPGLAQKYVRWLGEDGHLHFVSSSPWQLQAALDVALREGGYPRASYSLKTIRLKDPSVTELFSDPQQAKPLAIEAELSRHSNTAVVLVGDSGEKDPEVYAAVARRYPDRVRRIFIRNVSGEGPGAARWKVAFEGVSPDVWQVFEDASTLPDAL
jgi:hypothetical protein